MVAYNVICEKLNFQIQRCGAGHVAAINTVCSKIVISKVLILSIDREDSVVHRKSVACRTHAGRCRRQYIL
jgi:hypothetical protein